ncbi:MAG TPA: ABC transporter permease [Mycobacteriales bacterium]|jgi:ABC-2 type transport system permease protein|nr:ABC transporter permease [Mycobacteriales bacterium]
MSAASLAVRQVRYEQKGFWRNPTAAVFIVFFPLLFLFIFGNNDDAVKEYGGIPYHQFFVPAMLAYGLMNATYTNLAMTLTLRRENGLLKRLRVTPLPAWASFTGMAGNALIVGAAISVVVLVCGFVFFDLAWYGHWLAVLLTCAVAVVTFSALGAAVSTFVPNEDAAGPIVNIVYFLLVFTSGTFFPISDDSVLHRIASYFPIQHLNDAIITAFLPFGTHGPMHGFAWKDLGVMAIWAVGATIVAIRRWRWEPRRSG